MRIHQFSGKENGMMVIGKASEIRNFGKLLIEATSNLPEKEAVEWPPLVAELGFTNARSYSLSFHLETADCTNPKGNGFHSETMKIFLFGFAIVGIVSVAKWVVNIAL